jgi:hypothetical protein
MKISNRRATQRCNVSSFFYAKICSLLARRRGIQPSTACLLARKCHSLARKIVASEDRNFKASDVSGLSVWIFILWLGCALPLSLQREFEQDNEVRRRRRTWQFLPSAHYLAHTELDVTDGCSTCLPMCRCLWILTLILALIQKKTARHETISRLCPSAFGRNEVHDKFYQNIRCERRQKNEDGIWIHVSLFCPDQGKDLSRHS